MRSTAKLPVALVAVFLGAAASAGAAPEPVAVGPQYVSTHVYVAADKVAAFVASFVATFGGSAGKAARVTVTPTPSSTISQVAMTPAGFVSVFGFTTLIPYGFGEERTGYLVKDLDVAVRAARAAGAELVVAPFPDTIGRDAIIRWPGGVNMQLYWHTVSPNYSALITIPENRVYVSSDAADIFVRDFLAFSDGKLVSDTKEAPGEEIGRAGSTYRRLRLESGFGKMTVLVTDGHLPWPYGREVTGYAVSDLDQTLARAAAAGVEVIVAPYASDDRKAAMLRFPGGYIAEVHAP